MMKYFLISALLLNLINLPFSSLAQENGWQLKKDSEGILVYTRAVENSGINEFKAYTKIGSSSETEYP